MNKLLISALLLLLMTQCGQRKDESLRVPDRIVSVTNPQIVIISYDNEKHRFFKNAKQANLLTDEIDKLDSFL